jgi:N-terminal domain on NACHT_NTPase and P-loop NTPases
MAEAFAVLAIVSSIAQLVDLGSKIVSRLYEFQSSLDETPKTFRQIKTELPLLLDTLKATKEAIDAGLIKEKTAKALLPIIKACQGEIQSLDAIIVKAISAEEDSRRKRVRKEISSLFRNGDIEKISQGIHKYVQILTFYYAATSSTLQPLTGIPFSKL